MEELTVKKDFTDIYMQKLPNEYLEEMQRLHYNIPDKTKPLYLSLAEQLCKKLSRPINILDIGSSYGINSALMKYDSNMSELNDFFLRDDSPTSEQTKQFFKGLPANDAMNFYQIDISKPALQFSENVQLCKKGICVDLEKEDIETNGLPKFDMVIATGCIGYIGYKAFANLFEFLKKQHSDLAEQDIQNDTIFAFTVLRIFDMEKIQKTFDYYGYSLVQSHLKPFRQRRFSNSDEKQKTISLLHKNNIDTARFEDDGHFYSDFYVASPKKMESHLISMSRNMEQSVDVGML